MERLSIHRVPLQPTIHKQHVKQPVITSKQSFSQHLQEISSKQQLKISKHATERLTERNIHISDDEWKVVSEKVFEAHSKGVQHPLVLMDQAALIVSAKNATVITAMERKKRNIKFLRI